MDVLDHPPYSTDLRPCDFDLIPEMKVSLLGIRFANREDICASHTTDGIQRLPHRWQSWTSVDALGGYFEGC